MEKTIKLDEIRKQLTNCKSLDELKTVYRTLVKKYHPDKNTDDTTQIMQEINCVFDNMVKLLSVGFTEKKQKSVSEEAEKFKNFINELMNIDDILIEICGIFLWITGNTKPYKERFKELGFKWDRFKNAWKYYPDWYRPRSRRNYSLDEIRSSYGSKTVKKEKSNLPSRV